MAANANANDDYLPLNGAQQDGGGRRNDAPAPNHFDDISMLALASCLNYGLASAHSPKDDNNWPFLVISRMQQIGLLLIVSSKLALFLDRIGVSKLALFLDRIGVSKLAFFLDRFGVFLVFVSLLYACSSLKGLLVSTSAASCILIGVFGAFWGYSYFFNRNHGQP